MCPSHPLSLDPGISGFAMRILLCLFTLVTAVALCNAEAAPACATTPPIRAELEKAQSAPVPDASDFDHNIAPFQALRKSHPADFYVHLAYVDAVQRLGIEGHLRALTDEYQALANERPDSVQYRFLYTRTLIGRGTPGAIQQLQEILRQNPDFAPAHAALAGIYASEAFRDEPLERMERQKLGALCPGMVPLATQPEPPPQSNALDQAEHLLASNGDENRAVALAMQAIAADEWRLQRVRPFDWYTVALKRRIQADLQAEYWRMWGLQVRAYRKSGKLDKADATLVMMERRAAQARKDSAELRWQALGQMIRLYAEGNEKDRAVQKLDALRQLLAATSDQAHASQFEELRKLVEGESR